MVPPGVVEYSLGSWLALVIVTLLGIAWLCVTWRATGLALMLVLCCPTSDFSTAVHSQVTRTRSRPLSVTPNNKRATELLRTLVHMCFQFGSLGLAVDQHTTSTLVRTILRKCRVSCLQPNLHLLCSTPAIRIQCPLGILAGSRKCNLISQPPHGRWLATLLATLLAAQQRPGNPELTKHFKMLLKK